MSKIESAGYIVHNNEEIWGFGTTADEAWADFEREMAMANVEIVDERPEDGLGSYALRGDYSVRAASAALLADVRDMGGNRAWGVRDGVACTVAEDEAE